jgi:hypothetical protein
MYPGTGEPLSSGLPSAEQTIIQRTQAMTHGWSTYNGQKHTSTLKNGSVLEVASLQSAHLFRHYPGAKYGVITFES